MNDQPTPDEKQDGRVGFRDIYRAVGESEARIKEHISLVLLPITATLADHEVRLRSIETQGSDEARLAMQKAEVIRAGHEALVGRVEVLEDSSERRVGAVALLGAQRSFIILIGVIVSIVLGVVTLLHSILEPVVR